MECAGDSDMSIKRIFVRVVTTVSLFCSLGGPSGAAGTVNLPFKASVKNPVCSLSLDAANTEGTVVGSSVRYSSVAVSAMTKSGSELWYGLGKIGLAVSCDVGMKMAAAGSLRLEGNACDAKSGGTTGYTFCDAGGADGFGFLFSRAAVSPATYDATTGMKDGVWYAQTAAFPIGTVAPTTATAVPPVYVGLYSSAAKASVREAGYLSAQMLFDFAFK
jgi:hypothetical protein